MNGPGQSSFAQLRTLSPAAADHVAGLTLCLLQGHELVTRPMEPAAEPGTAEAQVEAGMARMANLLAGYVRLLRDPRGEGAFGDPTQEEMVRETLATMALGTVEILQMRNTRDALAARNERRTAP